MNALIDISRASVEAIAHAATYTVRVDGRRQYAVSGIAYGERHVLAVDHTVERDEDIKVTLPDLSVVSARVRGRDPRSNLVLLETGSALPASGRPATEAAKVGSLVFSVGRPDDVVEAVMGMVSAVGGQIRFRGGGSVEAFLATDTLRVPGFSGGPVVDVDGAVLGITMNSLREARSFAIGAPYAWKIAELLREGGTIRRGYLGMRSQPTTLSEAARGEIGRDQTTGLLVVGVESGAPAEAGGLLVGDIVVGFNGKPAREHEDLVDALGPEVVGKPVAVEVVRAGKLVRVEVKPGTAP